MKKILFFLILLLSFSPTLVFGAEVVQQEAPKKCHSFMTSRQSLNP